ncbi:hypothetical protein COU78_01275 [Candidatus Peregrinibacteria bacterium CG10_big_fil_rev_8_21_14_0_10_49_24]|nr:MAG: hypothetical protein COV83_04240 [Candidatus Peregrinibacteria bacterium CG11_big_fil_rev_8_21_14_0_20_49_14]PIR51357.1 MAG: hypothetical protein COU78_01275 [Candidatus Peregrinibacteria bacterium CG10_big_fil_rev_8_21_14_0_10_49_24]PJA68121.1 MAG: hypothetical protein CO157_01090 [Candidatus Peregrinibacteria bacterium CG_4_9_14_3_um_filter_49_12]
MQHYAAFLGHQPHISTAELAAVVPGFSLEKVLDKKIALFSATEPLKPSVLNALGGTVVLAEQIGGSELSLADLPKVLLNEITKKRGKVTFGLRTVGVSPKVVRQLYRKCKDALKKDGRASRYVGSDRKPAATVLLHDAGLLDGSQGCELTVIMGEDLFWVGKTIAAQDIDSYTKRDMEKPVRDTTVGLLPPKLAQILLNFGLWLATENGCKSAIKKTPVIMVFDPFCGTGVIPMEALLRGWPVLASDKAQKAIGGTTTNLDWIRKEEKILKKEVPSVVWKHDALKPFVLKELPDVVVTETSLGTPMKVKPTLKDAMKEKAENEALQEGFLRNAAETLPGVPLVCTWPVWRTKTKAVFLEKIWKVIEELPYDIVLPVEPEDGEKPTLFYRRPDHFVGREIVLLLPKQK